MEWAELHSRLLTIIAVAIIVIAAGAWFYQKAHQARARNASISLGEAQQAVEAGNYALAQSNLDKIVNRYGSTESGRQAQLLLAKVYYEKGQYQQGIQTLQKLVAANDELVQAQAYNLMGAGYEQSGKFAEAADAYRKAADAASGTGDRDTFLANAARALTSAGKTAEAKEIWSKLAADPASPANAEARVRLGELEVKAVKQG
jgi:tetratricopeptide (TPR) repeat protein